MPGNEQTPPRTQSHSTRRDILATVTGVAVGGASLNALSGTVAAWDRFDVAFPSKHTVWFVVGNDLQYDPPLVTHVLVETSDECAKCCVVEFTEDNATTYPDLFGDRPVIPYDAGDGTVLGVLPYNRHYEGQGRFSRPRCVLVNGHLDEAAAVKACQETACVQAAMRDHWNNHFKECWFEPLKRVDLPEDNLIDDCREITEPGTYKLVADLEPTTGDVCLEIRTDDVTILGNGHTIAGRALPDGIDSVGILSDAVPDEPGAGDETAPITIQNLKITGFERAVSISTNDTVQITESKITDCNRGVDLGVSRSDISLQLTGITITGCTREGVHSIGFNTVEISDSTFKRNGIGVSTSDTTLELSGSTIATNDETGLITSDGVVTITDTTIEKNGGHGITHRFIDMTAENVTVRENEDRQVGVLPPSTPEGAPALSLTATDLDIGNTTTIATPGTAVNALDAIPEAELPPLPDDVTPIAEGFEVIATGPISLDVRFDIGPTDEPVELLRFDGTDWEVVPDATVVDGILEATIEIGGIYVPVR